jgi:hypothetical protein
MSIWSCGVQAEELKGPLGRSMEISCTRQFVPRLSSSIHQFGAVNNRSLLAFREVVRG